MLNYIIRRILLCIVVLFIVTIVTFLFVELIPGDPARTILGQEATQAEVDALRKELWMDRPLVIRYEHWISGVLKGNLGDSIMYRQSVSSLIKPRLATTAHLASIAFILGNFLGICAGVYCAIRRGSILDTLITLIANMGIGLPVFWLGILGIYVFGLHLGWLPVQGYTSPFVDFWLSTKKIIMPVICMAIPPIAFVTRQTRSSLLDVMRQDYVRTAWSKGLRERKVVFVHVLKNGLIPVVTFMGIGLGTTLGGSVLVENVFNIPGMGRFIVFAALNKDFPVMQASTLLLASVIIFVNLLVDIVYGWLDPKIHYQ